MKKCAKESRTHYESEYSRIRRAKQSFLERLDDSKKEKIARRINVDSYLMGDDED